MKSSSKGTPGLLDYFKSTQLVLQTSTNFHHKLRFFPYSTSDYCLDNCHALKKEKNSAIIAIRGSQENTVLKLCKNDWFPAKFTYERLWNESPENGSVATKLVG